jgi:hypothetical protein
MALPCAAVTLRGIHARFAVRETGAVDEGELVMELSL